MEQVFDAAYVTLHVRISNKTAFHLYRNTLGYECAPPPSCTTFSLVRCQSGRTSATRGRVSQAVPGIA